MRNKSILIIIFSITFMAILVSCFYNNLSSNKLQINNNMISIYLQDINGEYHKQENKEFPKEGYSLDKAQSYCENESKIYYKDSKIKVKGNKTDKCYIYFSNDNIVRDLSGNHYDGVIQNGGKVQIDEEGNQGLYFDGVDDFVDIVDLPETINWEGGFTIEFEAKWKSFNSWYSRILDFGNGALNDNIFISNEGTSSKLVLDTVYDNVEYRNAQSDLELNKKEKIKFLYLKIDNGYKLTPYINDVEQDSVTYDTITVKNIKRVNNYLGRSNWDGDGYFNGYIYNLKITDATGNIILWYDFT